MTLDLLIMAISGLAVFCCAGDGNQAKHPGQLTHPAVADHAAHRE
jgi:hypothetical protein